MIFIENSKLEGRWVDPKDGKIPVKDVAEFWLASRLSVSAATHARDSGLMRKHIIRSFGNVPVSRISRLDVQRWIASLSEQGYAPWTVRKAYQLLSGVMAEAVEHRMIVESPCRRISLPRFEHQERKFLSAEEVERLVAAFDGRYRALVYSAAYLGCRWEELAGLKRVHLNLLRRHVRIVGTIQRHAGSYRYSEETKTGASRRTLELPGFLVEVLNHHLAQAPDSEWVFPSPEGGFLRYDNGRRRVWDPATRAGFNGLTFHELRHTAAALMVDEGADPLQVQRRLGHKDVRTTLGLYGHLFPNRESGLNDALEKAFRAARSQTPAAPSRPGAGEVGKGSV